MISEKEKLLIKSEAVKECAKFLSKQIKQENQFLEHELQDERAFKWFDDCGDYYVEKVTKRKSRIEVMIEQKVSLEKYAKKLRHMSDETDEQQTNF